MKNKVRLEIREEEFCKIKDGLNVFDISKYFDDFNNLKIGDELSFVSELDGVKLPIKIT